MDWLETALAAAGLKLKLVIAAAVGSLISLRFFDELKTWERWTTFLAGWALASWLSEGAATFFDVTKPSLETGMALLIALFGMAMTSAVMKVIRDTDWAGLIKTILSFRWGGGGK